MVFASRKIESVPLEWMKLVWTPIQPFALFMGFAAMLTHYMHALETSRAHWSTLVLLICSMFLLGCTMLLIVGKLCAGKEFFAATWLSYVSLRHCPPTDYMHGAPSERRESERLLIHLSQQVLLGEHQVKECWIPDTQLLARKKRFVRTYNAARTLGLMNNEYNQGTFFKQAKVILAAEEQATV